MRVSLRQPVSPDARLDDHTGSLPLLLATGPHTVLGRSPGQGGAASPLVVNETALFGPRSAVIGSVGGAVRAGSERGGSPESSLRPSVDAAEVEQPLVVSDTGHHRLLLWRKCPRVDETPADLLIGQPDFFSEGRNGRRDPDASSLNVPTGVALVDGVLAVADAWNHRVLVWHTIPTRSNQPADVVLGQADFTGALANRGRAEAAANTLNWCYGVAILDGRLVVADTGNRRVLVWDGIPEANGAPADLVLGQMSFTSRDEGAGVDAGPIGMRWPHSVALCRDRLMVSDAGDNRVLVWNELPGRPGVPADFALGQTDFQSLEHNRGSYLPDAGSMNMPYGLAADDDVVLVADTANSRLLGWSADDLEFGGKARGVAAQSTFRSKGDNRWGIPERDSLCWPYWVSLHSGTASKTAVISDSGNNRVVLWELDQGFAL